MTQKLRKTTTIASIAFVIVSPFQSTININKSNLNKSSLGLENTSNIQLILIDNKTKPKQPIDLNQLNMANILNLFSKNNYKNLKYLSIAIAIMVFSVFTFQSIKTLRESATKFEDISIDNQIEKLNTVKDRTNINLNTFSKNDLASLVGMILVVDENKTEQNFDLKNTIRKYRPKMDQLDVESVGQILYQGNLSNRIKADGSYLPLAGEINNNQIAEVVIRDEIRVGYRYPSTIPIAQLDNLEIPFGKTYYFVESVTLTSAQYKYFEKKQNKGSIKGKAFSSNGEIYVSNSEAKYEPIVSINAFNIGLTKKNEGAINSELNNYLKDINILTSEQHEDLLNLLIEKSKPGATRTINNSTISLQKYDIDYGKNMSFLKQEKDNGCWATATAMLKSWKDQRSTKVEDVFNEAGNIFKNLYQDDVGLADQNKEKFLESMNLTFEWGQSYTVEGLHELLLRHGPIWFTVPLEPNIDDNTVNTSNTFNTHATIITGLVGSGDMLDTYILYVNPLEGKQQTMRYGEFMRWYEKAAFSSQIQVVHY